MESHINKVIYGGKTLLDLTADTITPDKLAKGITAHDKTGASITGTSTKDSDTSDATATGYEILEGKTAYVREVKVTGSMANNGAVDGKISTKDGVYKVPCGFHDGSGEVALAESEKEKLVATNIRKGITILGVGGTMSGSEDMKPQSKEVTPGATAQQVLPDTGYNCISQVTVKAIPYAESENAAGGKTATIA